MNARSTCVTASLALSLGMACSAGEAQALPMPAPVLGCSVCNGASILPTSEEIDRALVGLSILPLTGGLVVGIGSSKMVYQGRVSHGWFVTSYVLGALQVGCAALWGISTGGEGRGLSVAMTVLHSSIAAFDLTMPTIGYVRGIQPRVTPVVVGGQDVGGRWWGGAGVALSRF